MGKKAAGAGGVRAGAAAGGPAKLGSKHDKALSRQRRGGASKETKRAKQLAKRRELLQKIEAAAKSKGISGGQPQQQASSGKAALVGSIRSLKDALPDSVGGGPSTTRHKDPTPFGAQVLTHTIRNKSRQALIAKEVAHFGEVVNFEPFKENPFDAIQQHIASTIELSRRARGEARQDGDDDEDDDDDDDDDSDEDM